MQRYILIGALGAVATAVVIGGSGGAAAHGGGLNADGCHTNRKTGDYHCHRGQAPAPRKRFGLSGSGGGGAFASCTAARAAGAAPVRRGDAGYGRHLDRDNDGIGCE